MVLDHGTDEISDRMMASFGTMGERWGTWLLGALLLAQGTGKLFDAHGYIVALERFQVLPARAVAPVGAAWIAAEVFAGAGLLAVGLVSGVPRSLALGATLAGCADAVGYVALTGGAHLRGIWVPNCTCFGVFFPQPLSPFVLAQDVAMLAWTGWQLIRVAAR